MGHRHGGEKSQADCAKVISLSDIFISPLEDMYAIPVHEEVGSWEADALIAS